jgi:hypothetical protein
MINQAEDAADHDNVAGDENETRNDEDNLKYCSTALPEQSIRSKGLVPAITSSSSC